MMNKDLYAMEKWVNTKHVWSCVVGRFIQFFCLSEYGFVVLDNAFNDPGHSGEELTITEEDLPDIGFVITIERSDIYVEGLGRADKFYFDNLGTLIRKEHIEIRPNWDDTDFPF